MNDWVTIDGGYRRTGLLIPEHNTTAMPMYAASGPIWTKQQILEAEDLKDRRPRRETFGDGWIKDQNGRGACAGYAAASCVERVRFLRGLDHVELSGDGIYAAVNGGRDQGSTLERNMKWLRDHGVPPASEVPRHEYRKDRIPARAYVEGKRFRGFDCYAIRTEIELASALAAGFICVVAVHAGNGGRAPDGLIDWTNGPGNHSVVVDDLRFRDGRFEFETANSWGLRWGNRGRGWLSWAHHFSNPIKNHMFYAVRSSSDDPDGDNPPSI